MFNAEFIGAVQILVYVGAISVLMAFAVMFLRTLSKSATPSSYRPFSFIISVLVFISFVIGIYNIEWKTIDILDHSNDKNIVEALSEKYYELGYGEQIYISNNQNIDSGLLAVENEGCLYRFYICYRNIFSPRIFISISSNRLGTRCGSCWWATDNEGSRRG